MKKLIALLLALAMMAGLTAAFADGTLVFGTSADYAPFEFMYPDESGTMVYGGIDVMGFCGDLGDAGASQSNFWTYAQNVMDAVSQKGVTGVYTTGNHEYSPGNYSSSSTNTTQQKYKINTEAATGGSSQGRRMRDPGAPLPDPRIYEQDPPGNAFLRRH